MRLIARLLLTAVIMFATGSDTAWAGRSGHSQGYSHSSGGTTQVRGYYRKDGTYVAPYVRRSQGSGPTPGYASPSARPTSPALSGEANGVERDSRGRVERSEAAKRAFEKETGYPHGRPGYVVDHIIPLARGGADDPSNMQWQTIAEAKAKDKVELGRGPGRRHRNGN